MSLAYPPSVAPMSKTTGSPAAMTRSEAVWWGEAEFGPEPTIWACSAPSCPSATRRARPSWATFLSVRHPERHRQPNTEEHPSRSTPARTRTPGSLERGGHDPVGILGLLPAPHLRD